MKRLFAAIPALLVLGIIGAGVVYRFTMGAWPQEQRLKNYIAEREYERTVQVDEMEFGRMPTATAEEEREIRQAISVSKSSFSTHRDGSWGYVHVTVDKGKDVLPLKAKIEQGYMRLHEDKDWNCFTFPGNGGPIGYVKHKAGLASTFSGGLSGVWWGDKDALTMDLLVGIKGRTVLVKNVVISGGCANVQE